MEELLMADHQHFEDDIVSAVEKGHVETRSEG
jgi:hypothetical protein